MMLLVFFLKTRMNNMCFTNCQRKNKKHLKITQEKHNNQMNNTPPPLTTQKNEDVLWKIQTLDELKESEEINKKMISEIYLLNCKINNLIKENVLKQREIENGQLQIQNMALKYTKKICMHITFFYDETRFQCLNKIIDEAGKYRYTTHIFIHTNQFFEKNDFLLNTSPHVNVSVVFHDLGGEHPFYLSWKCRILLKEQLNSYDYFMYMEDDTLVHENALEYWFQHKDVLLQNGFNLGFIRVNKNEKGVECMVDFPKKIANYVCKIENNTYIVNNEHPYCGFWIYDKNEFTKFVNSVFYNPENIKGYDIREQSAVGLHGCCTYFYKTTVLPYHNGCLPKDSIILHMPKPNNHSHSKILFDDGIQF